MQHLSIGMLTFCLKYRRMENKLFLRVLLKLYLKTISSKKAENYTHCKIKNYRERLSFYSHCISFLPLSDVFSVQLFIKYLNTSDCINFQEMNITFN